MGTIKTTNIEPIADNGTVTLGSSGDTFTLGSGVKQSNLMYPAFEAKLSSNQTILNNIDTKITFDTEEFDTDSAYDNSSNYRFTPQVAGKYFVYLSLGINADADSNLVNIYCFIYRNGTQYKISHDNYASNNSRFGTVNVSAVVTFNGSSDYIEANAQALDSSGSAFIQSGTFSTFGAYRIGS
jgi:hypothetical protein